MMLKCGLLGKKLGHSYSPRIHSLLGDYEYLLYEKNEDELEDFLLNGRWDGLNVTIPYKKAVIKYCDKLSPAALRTGSVNTLVKTGDNRITGDNTDLYGFSSMLDRTGTDLSGKKALVLGSGGASLSVRTALQERGANVLVISRSGEDNYDNLSRHHDAAVIVNTTPVGMYPANGISPVEPADFKNCEAVLDIIYNPCRTALVMKAQELGIKSGSGLHMLVAQALRSSELFTGSSIQISEIDRIEKQLSFEMQNIILTGMPGSGKSTIARILGEMTGKAVAELDDEILKATGYTPEKYIESFGEAAFRKAESQIAERFGKESGLIISTGGGVVTVESNYPLLHQNGVIFWIRRNIDVLPVDSRPLSKAQGLSQMYEKRKPMYERFADAAVDNDSDPRETARRILKHLTQEVTDCYEL